MIRLGIYAAIGAVLGSLARFGVSEFFTMQGHSTFPWATFCVNVVGAFCIGLFVRFASIAENDSMRAFVVTGLLGGFTTFSALALEATELFDTNLMVALVYMFSTFVIGILATSVALGRHQ